MNLGDTKEDDLEGLLRALDEADAALRGLYRQLADDPDRATEYESKRKDLHGRRAELAQQVGLALLAERRANVRTTVEVAPKPIAVAPSTATSANGDTAASQTT